MSKRGWIMTVRTKDGSPAPGGHLSNPSDAPQVTISTWSRSENQRRTEAAEVADLEVSVRRAPRRRASR